MSDVPGVSPDGERPDPGPVGGDWLSFEQRMRRRRAATCVQHAERAIEGGNVSEARAALIEAQALTPDAPEIEALEARLAAIRPARGPWRMSYGLAGLVLLLLTVGGMSFATHFWPASGDGSGGAAAPSGQVAASTPVPPAQQLTASETDVAAAGLRVIHETVRVPTATPRLVEEMPPLPAMPGPPVADAEPEPEREREPVVLAVNRAPAPPPPDTPQVRSELPAETLPNPALPVRMAAPPPPDPVPAATSGRTETPPARPDAVAARVDAPDGRSESSSPPPPTRDESAIVRSVLQQYESAYSSLDAAAASAVWPAVNRNELARAFDGLASQRVSLGSCDVAVHGPAARATCSGSATWEPKVGGGVRTEARRWNFELKKSDEGWQIQRAIARGGG